MTYVLAYDYDARDLEKIADANETTVAEVIEYMISVYKDAEDSGFIVPISKR